MTGGLLAFRGYFKLYNKNVAGTKIAFRNACFGGIILTCI